MFVTGDESTDGSCQIFGHPRCRPHGQRRPTPQAPDNTPSMSAVDLLHPEAVTVQPVEGSGHRLLRMASASHHQQTVHHLLCLHNTDADRGTTPRSPRGQCTRPGHRSTGRTGSAVAVHCSSPSILTIVGTRTSTRRSRRWPLAVATLVVLVGAFYAAPVVVTELDDGASVPSPRDAALPEGLVIADSTTECASGGCWLDIVIDADQSSRDSLAQLKEADGHCSVVSAFDLRSVCTAINATDSRHISLSYKRHLDL